MFAIMGHNSAIWHRRALMLVHEPEAAALTVLKEVQEPIAMSEGDTYIVVDAGGGTVDITCHMVSEAAVTVYMLLSAYVNMPKLFTESAVF